MPERTAEGSSSTLTQEDAERIVSQSGWLARRPASFREALLARSHLRSYARGTKIYRVGDAPTGVYGLVEGLLRVELLVVGVGEQVALVGRPGFWIGVASSLSRRKRALTVSCAVRSTLIHLPLSGFDRLAASQENLRHFSALAVENHDTSLGVIRDLMNPIIPVRIASRLQAIFAQGTSHPKNEISITQADLAALCNVSRKTINHELARFEAAGLVSRAYGKLTLLNEPALRKLTQGDDSGLRAL